ncbi:hypothetical protein M2322_003195 [Rhodoblastus acidophilus]|uniref:hypothetical protein n=1 Tax=Rhodoblastus acidophilus TaxID=1074 RepID=UPI0022256D0D|nr:hypothetical protein [Rhodoblastus acidophilus]MCW2317631.1 hypothetical protein [Rhodoblastus acidophilus]
MKIDGASNDNRQDMGLLPAPVSCVLFDIGWRQANELFMAATSAKPTPTINELLLWVVGAREEMAASIAQSLQSFCEFQVDEDGRRLAEQVALKGFDAFLRVQP